MKKYMFLVAVLVAVAFALPAFAQSGLTDERIGANAQIKMSKIKPVQFSSAPSAATWFNATLKALAKGDFYLNTTSNTFHYYNGSAWTLIGGGSAGAVIIAYAGEPSAAQYLAASGKALAVNDLVFDTTAKVLKQCTSLTGPVYKPAIYSASGTGVKLSSNENNTGTGVAFILDNDNALEDADIFLQLQEATAAFFSIYANGDVVAAAGQMSMGPGSCTAGDVTYSFAESGRTDNGISNTTGSDNLQICVAGSAEFAIGAAATTVAHPLQGPTGAATAGNVSYSFSSHNNTGMYCTGADAIGFAAAGANVATFGGTVLTAAVPVAVPVGAVNADGLYFTGDVDTGLWSAGVASLNIGVAGTNIAAFTANTMTIPTGQVLAHTDAPAAGTTVANKAYVDNALLFGTQLTAAGGVLVNLGAIAVTPLYTCPAGRTCIIEKVVFRSASASVDQAADATYNIGWQAVASGVVASVALVNPTATTTAWHPVVVGVHSVAEQTVGAATEVLNFNVTAACTTSPTTIRVDVFGYSY